MLNVYVFTTIFPATIPSHEQSRMSMLAIKSTEENMVLQTLVLSVILVRSLRFISLTGTMFSILEEKNEKVPSHGLLQQKSSDFLGCIPRETAK